VFDVPAYLKNIHFHSIEDQVSLVVFFLVNVVKALTGKLLDALDVIG